MKNLTEEAKKLCAELKTKGFNGIHFDTARVEADVTLEEVWDEVEQEGELNPDQYNAWRENYVCFILEPYFPDHSGTESVYFNPGEYDTRSFYRDLKDHVLSVLGEDVEITQYKTCGEWECTRKGYKHPENPYAEDSEDF